MSSIESVDDDAQPGAPSAPPASLPPSPPPPPPPPRRRWSVALVIALGVAVIAIAGQTLRHRAASRVNHVALSSAPKGVTVVAAAAGTYRDAHRYVGTLRPWIEAHVGPQFVAAYVSTVLVRPGAPVRHGDVVATLDCRDASARNRAIAAEARALQARGVALASQAARIHGLLDGGYVAENESDQRTAESLSEQAQVQARQAQLIDTTLAVDDCVLRAPFDGDVGARLVDPGAFVRPGTAVVDVVDRRVIRLVVDVPETDFDAVAPGIAVRIHLLAVHRDLVAPVSRRSPSADPLTRTVHIEVDIADPEQTIPVNTTAGLSIDVGDPRDATVIPLAGADIRGERAVVYVVEHGVASRRVVPILGEIGGQLFVATTLTAGTQVVVEGRAALENNDRVAPQLRVDAPPATVPGARP